MSTKNIDYKIKAINEGILSELGINGFTYGYKSGVSDFELIVKDRIYDLQMMQIQAGDDYEFCLQMEYAIKELNRLLTPNN